MTLISPSRRPSHPVLHAVTSAAVCLAIGLPFLFLLSRTAQFYGYADSEFGFWLATRALPAWAILAILLGVATALGSANRERSLAFMLVRSGSAALILATILTAVSLAATSSLRDAQGVRSGQLPAPLEHFFARHLFEDPASRKIDFDTCMLESPGAGTGARAGVLNYEFCIPDSQAFREQVMLIDTTARFDEFPGRSWCGPGRILCTGSTRQVNARSVLQRLSGLPYVRRIRGVAFVQNDSLPENR